MARLLEGGSGRAIMEGERTSSFFIGSNGAFGSTAGGGEVVIGWMDGRATCGGGVISDAEEEVLEVFPLRSSNWREDAVGGSASIATCIGVVISSCSGTGAVGGNEVSGERDGSARVDGAIEGGA